jgi:uncharacterized protein (DUF1778 family)
LALKPTTVRFTPDALAAVREASEELGCSIGQFVREAAIARAILVAEPTIPPAAVLRLIGEVTRRSSG